MLGVDSGIHLLKILRTKRAICYHNTKPDMFVPFIGSLGGGVLVGTNVETIDIAIPHLKVQFSQSLHQRTTLAVKALIEA